MSEKDIDSINRRKVLQGTAMAGAVSLGAVALSGSATADSERDGKLATLEANGLLLSEADIDTLSTELDIDVTEEVRTGRALLERLKVDGLLAEASLDALPDFGATDTDGEIHDLSEQGSRSIAFTTSTERGRLQVTYSENSAPFAALSPENGDNVIIYTAPDGENYERIETDLEKSGSAEDPSTQDCGDCGGCNCVGDWCLDGARPRTQKEYCNTCSGQECITTNICGC